MGEADPRSRKLIKRVTGFEPESGMTDDGMCFLRIGDIELVAGAGLWSDPSAWQHVDGSLRVSWADQNALIPAAIADIEDGVRPSSMD